MLWSGDVDLCAPASRLAWCAPPHPSTRLDGRRYEEDNADKCLTTDTPYEILLNGVPPLRAAALRRVRCASLSASVSTAQVTYVMVLEHMSFLVGAFSEVLAVSAIDTYVFDWSPVVAHGSSISAVFLVTRTGTLLLRYELTVLIPLGKVKLWPPASGGVGVVSRAPTEKWALGQLRRSCVSLACCLCFKHRQADGPHMYSVLSVLPADMNTIESANTPDPMVSGMGSCFFLAERIWPRYSTDQKNMVLTSEQDRRSMSWCCLWKTPSHILSFFRVKRTRLCYVKLLKILVALPHQRNTCAWYPLKILAALVRQRNTCELCQRWTVSWRQLATSFEDVMATYHPPRIAEEVDDRSE